MKIQGRNTIAASREQVWDAINDPAVLARTLPGCESLEVVEDGHYKARVTAGVASIRGTYTGDVTLSDLSAPSSLKLAAQGAGAPGTIGADIDVGLEDEGDGTAIAWDAEAIVGGMIGGVGQRMLSGVATRMAGEFFDNLETDILSGGAPAMAGAPAEGTAEPVPATVGAPEAGAQAPAAGTVFPGTAPSAAEGIAVDDTVKLAGAFVLGAAVALVGVLIGRRTR